MDNQVTVLTRKGNRRRTGTFRPSQRRGTFAASDGFEVVACVPRKWVHASTCRSRPECIRPWRDGETGRVLKRASWLQSRLPHRMPLGPVVVQGSHDISQPRDRSRGARHQHRSQRGDTRTSKHASKSGDADVQQQQRSEAARCQEGNNQKEAKGSIVSGVSECTEPNPKEKKTPLPTRLLATSRRNLSLHSHSPASLSWQLRCS